MIIDVVRGDYFAGLIDYIMRWGKYASENERPRVLACVGLFSPVTAAAELSQQAAMAPGRTRRVVHIYGRAEKGLTDAQFRDTAERALAAAGLANRPYIIVVHDDDGHFHLATVEVDEFGRPPPRRLVSSSLRREVSREEFEALPKGDAKMRSWDSHLGWRLTKVSRQVEIDFGLRRLGGERDSFDEIRIPDWQIKREAVDGRVPLGTLLGPQIKSALDLTTWDERVAQLELHGLGLRPYDGGNKKRQGLQIYVLKDVEHSCTGSSLGKRYGLGTLDQRSTEPFVEWHARWRQSDAHVTDKAPGQVPRLDGESGLDPNLQRLTSEFQAERARYDDREANKRLLKSRARAELQRIRDIARLLRAQLLASHQVSRSWAQLIVRIARTQLMENFRTWYAQEMARLKARSAKKPTWEAFLASKAKHDATAAGRLARLRNRQAGNKDAQLRSDTEIAGAPKATPIKSIAPVAPTSHATDALTVSPLPEPINASSRIVSDATASREPTAGRPFEVSNVPPSPDVPVLHNAFQPPATDVPAPKSATSAPALNSYRSSPRRALVPVTPTEVRDAPSMAPPSTGADRALDASTAMESPSGGRKPKTLTTPHDAGVEPPIRASDQQESVVGTSRDQERPSSPVTPSNAADTTSPVMVGLKGPGASRKPDPVVSQTTTSVGTGASLDVGKDVGLKKEPTIPSFRPRVPYLRHDEALEPGVAEQAQMHAASEQPAAPVSVASRPSTAETPSDLDSIREVARSIGTMVKGSAAPHTVAKPGYGDHRAISLTRGATPSFDTKKAKQNLRSVAAVRGKTGKNLLPIGSEGRSSKDPPQNAEARSAAPESGSQEAKAMSGLEPIPNYEPRHVTPVDDLCPLKKSRQESTSQDPPPIANLPPVQVDAPDEQLAQTKAAFDAWKARSGR